MLPPQAQRMDELDITTDEELEVLEWDDGDGWCRGRNKNRQEGFFPQSYVQPSSRASSPLEKRMSTSAPFQSLLLATPTPLVSSAGKNGWCLRVYRCSVA